MITRDQISVLEEVFNIGVGRAAGALNEILDAHISLQVPDVGIWSEFDNHDMIKSVKKIKKRLLPDMWKNGVTH